MIMRFFPRFVSTKLAYASNISRNGRGVGCPNQIDGSSAVVFYRTGGSSGSSIRIRFRSALRLEFSKTLAELSVFEEAGGFIPNDGHDSVDPVLPGAKQANGERNR